MQNNYLSKWSWSSLLLALITSLNLSAQEQELFQGFEGDTTDTWNYTVNPATYEVPDDDDFWTVSSANNQLQPASGQGFWFMRDLDNPNGGGSMAHTMDFEAVDVQGFLVNALSFKYNVVGFESADAIGYIIETEPGTAFNMDAVMRDPVMVKALTAFPGAELISENTVRIAYSEPMDMASVTDPMNYTTNAAIETITYVEPGGSTFPYVDVQYAEPFVDGQAYSISPGHQVLS